MANKKVWLFIPLLFSSQAFAYDIIPQGHDNNLLYYQMGGVSDFALPASS